MVRERDEYLLLVPPASLTYLDLLLLATRPLVRELVRVLSETVALLSDDLLAAAVLVDPTPLLIVRLARVSWLLISTTLFLKGDGQKKGS